MLRVAVAGATGLGLGGCSAGPPAEGLPEAHESIEKGGSGAGSDARAEAGPGSVAWFHRWEARRLSPTGGSGGAAFWDRRIVSGDGVIYTVLAEQGGAVRLASAASDWPEAVDLGPASEGLEDLALTRDAKRLLMLVRRVDGGRAVYTYDLALRAVGSVTELRVGGDGGAIQAGGSGP